MKTVPTILRAMTKTSAKTDLCGRPFRVCYTRQNAHALTRNVSNHQRSRRFGHLSTPSPRRVPKTASFVSNVANRSTSHQERTLAQGRRADTPANFRKFMRAKDKSQLCLYSNPNFFPLTLHKYPLAMSKLARLLPVTSLDGRQTLTTKELSRNQAVSAETRGPT